MQLTNRDAERLVTEGVQLLRQGRPAEARGRFEQVTATGRANSQIWLLLATACRAASDAAAEEAAVDQLLINEPRLIRGHVMKADCRARAHDNATALGFYQSALQIASGQQVPAELATELRRAEAKVAEFEEQLRRNREASLVAQGYPPDRRSPRFQRSLDILSGQARIFVQEPTAYYFPELPQIQFYDPADFNWVSAIEAATDTIRDELTAVLKVGTDDFRAYIRRDRNRPRADNNPLLDNSDWSALFLCENGVVSDEVVARCPRTWEALQAAPLPRIINSPTAMFSLLRAGTRIPPHTGSHNARLICHLPLIVPPGCGFRVGNETRLWQEGKLLIFDDTIEHEAWNESDQDRVVLIFDIWRPELSAREREEIGTLFSISGFGERTH